MAQWLKWNLRRTWRQVLGFVLVLGVLPAVLLACSVPVFRYALEHWQADPYRVTLLYEEDLQTADLELLAWLDIQRLDGANIDVSQIDLREQPEYGERLTQSFRDNLPGMIVQLPDRASEQLGRPSHPVGWSAWEREELHRLIQSPAREELVLRLLAGHVVWVFLESDITSAGPNQNNAAFKLLNDELEKLQQTLKLPEIDEADRAEFLKRPEELKIQFSSMRVSRKDPREKWFVEMLLSIEPDLREEDIVSQPMVFPVFGRGRALYALVGAGIEPGTISQAATFLTGACQCTVKADNPGVDLLLPVLWDQQVLKTAPQEVDVPLVGLMLPGSEGEANAEAEIVSEPEPDRPTLLTYSHDERGLSGTVAIVWIVAMVLVVFGTIVLIWGSVVMRG